MAFADVDHGPPYFYNFRTGQMSPSFPEIREISSSPLVQPRHVSLTQDAYLRTTPAFLAARHHVEMMLADTVATPVTRPPHPPSQTPRAKPAPTEALSATRRVCVPAPSLPWRPLPRVRVSRGSLPAAPPERRQPLKRLPSPDSTCLIWVRWRR